MAKTKEVPKIEHFFLIPPDADRNLITKYITEFRNKNYKYINFVSESPDTGEYDKLRTLIKNVANQFYVEAELTILIPNTFDILNSDLDLAYKGEFAYVYDIDDRSSVKSILITGAVITSTNFERGNEYDGLSVEDQFQLSVDRLKSILWMSDKIRNSLLRIIQDSTVYFPNIKHIELK